MRDIYGNTRPGLLLLIFVAAICASLLGAMIGLFLVGIVVGMIE